MDASSYADLLKAEGFEPIGSVDYDVRMNLYWHPKRQQEVAIVTIGDWILLRGVKSYYLVATARSGEEMYARDLAALDDYLAAHFDAVTMSLCHSRRITLSLARKRIREKKFRHMAASEDIGKETLEERLGEISAERAQTESDLRGDQNLLWLDSSRRRPDLLQRYLKGQVNDKRRQVEQLRAEAKAVHHKLTLQQQYERAYLREGQGTSLLFAVSSTIQIAQGPQEFSDALKALVKELEDIHKYQVTQQLQGGRLKIYIEEVRRPGLCLLTRWTGAVLNPLELARLGPNFTELQEAVEEHFMVHPRRDIVIGGSVKDQTKRPGVQTVDSFLKRIERVPQAAAQLARSPKSRMPVWIGNVPRTKKQVGPPWEHPLDLGGHVLASGRTGSGKTMFLRVLIEGSTAYDDLSIVLNDPGNQAAGLLCREDRPDILARYKLFGLKPEQARSFVLVYNRPGRDIGEPVPKDLRELATGRRIICYKELEPEPRCELFANVQNALFDACSGSESELPVLLNITEEPLEFMRKGVPEEARRAAQRAELSIDRGIRQARKYGMVMAFPTQSGMDFAREMASVRQNVKTRIFLPNADRELELAGDYLKDPKMLVQLRPGEAFLVNPVWGVVRILVRPPLSKVWELKEKETRKLVDPTPPTPQRLSEDANAVLQTARQHQEDTGFPAKSSWLAEQSGIRSRRKWERALQELQKARLVRLERSEERGRPVVVVPISARPGTRSAQKSAQQRKPNGT